MKKQRLTNHHHSLRLMGMLSFLLLCLQMNTPAFAKKQTVTLKIVETSDVHGCFFPHDFINNTDMSGSLARVSTFYKQLKGQYPESTLLLDNGDILQRDNRSTTFQISLIRYNTILQQMSSTTSVMTQRRLATMT